MYKSFLNFVSTQSAITKIVAVVAIATLSIVMVLPRDNSSSAATVGGVSQYCSQQPGNRTGGCYGQNVTTGTTNAAIKTITCDASGNIPANTVKSYLGNAVNASVTGNGVGTAVNNTSCKLPVSMASYQMYDNTLGGQKLYDSTGVTTIESGHSAILSVRIPPCTSQIDLYYGSAPAQLDNANSAGPRTLAWNFNFDTQGKNLVDLTGPFCGQTRPLVCIGGIQTAATDTVVTFSAQGGTGTYSWSAFDGTPAMGNNTSFTTKFATAGNKTVKVTDGSQTAFCFVQITGTTPSPLICTPASQTVFVDTQAVFAAQGGSGSYTWSAQGAKQTNGTGATFATSYATAGSKLVIVTSGTQSAQCTVQVNTQQTTVVVSKTGPATANPNQTISYTISVQNTGSVTANNVVVTDDIAAPLTFVNATGATCSSAASARSSRGTVTCALGDIAAGQSKAITLTFRVDAQVTCQSVITNTASVSLANGTGANSNPVVTTVNCPAPTLICAPGTQTVTVGQTAAFVATGGTGTYAWQATEGNPTTGSGSTFATTYTTSGTKTVVVTSGAQTANCTVVVNPQTPPPSGTPRLTIQKVVQNVTQNGSETKSGTAKAGDILQYRVKVTNDGTANANNVTVTDALTNSSTLTNFGSIVVSTGFSGSITSGLNLGTLTPGQSVTITYRYTVASTTTSIGVCNTATAAATNVASVQDTACLSVPRIEGDSVILSFAKAASNDTKKQDATKVTASPEDFITYTLTVKNTGTSDQTNFTITDDLSGVLPLADMIDTGGATLSGTVLTYPQTTVPANGSIQRQFKVRIKASLASNISYVMANTYGNTVSITINKPQTYTAPKTGGNTTPLAATGFGIILAAAAAVATNANLRKMIFG